MLNTSINMLHHWSRNMYIHMFIASLLLHTKYSVISVMCHVLFVAGYLFMFFALRFVLDFVDPAQTRSAFAAQEHYGTLT